ncbi:MAG: hypothetical protein WCG01_02545 [bacterium]
MQLPFKAQCYRTAPLAIWPTVLLVVAYLLGGPAYHHLVLNIFQVYLLFVVVPVYLFYYFWRSRFRYEIDEATIKITSGYFSLKTEVYLRKNIKAIYREDFYSKLFQLARINFYPLDEAGLKPGKLPVAFIVIKIKDKNNFGDLLK